MNLKRIIVIGLLIAMVASLIYCAINTFRFVKGNQKSIVEKYKMLAKIPRRYMKKVPECGSPEPESQPIGNGLGPYYDEENGIDSTRATIPPRLKYLKRDSKHQSYFK